MASAIEIEGLDPLIKKLEKIGRLDALKAGMKVASKHVYDKLRVYPPSSNANVPGGPGSHWYKRGTGGFYALVGGGISSYGGSEKLGKRWTQKISRGGKRADIGNNVSYGPYVQGKEQMGYHEERGWKSTDKVAKEEAGEVNKILAHAINKALK